MRRLVRSATHATPVAVVAVVVVIAALAVAVGAAAGGQAVRQTQLAALPLAARARSTLPLAARARSTLPRSTLPAAAVIGRDGRPTYGAAAAALPPRPAGCVPSGSGPVTEYGFEAKISGGTVDLAVDPSTGTSVSVAGVDGEICGIVTPVDGPPGSGCPVEAQLRVPADGVILDPVMATLHVAGMSPQLPIALHAPPLVDDLGCASSAGGFKVALDAAFTATTGLFGLGCALRLGVDLAGVLTGPLSNMAGVLHSAAYTVGAPAPGAGCPGTLPAHIAAILGLPLQGSSGIDLPISGTIYQP